MLKVIELEVYMNTVSVIVNNMFVKQLFNDRSMGFVVQNLSLI